MKAVQYIPVLIKPKYNNILQFNHKAVGVFLSFYIPAYIYIYIYILYPIQKRENPQRKLETRIV